MTVEFYPEDRERFLSYVCKTRKSCWTWVGGISSDGYGGFKLSVKQSRARQTIAAHRASFLIFRGAIPRGLFVLHKCDVPACVNPAHLFLGTQLDNMRDRNAKGRANPAKGMRFTSAKLTDELVRAIRADNYRTPARAWAQLIGCSSTAVDLVRWGKTWKHVV